MAPSIEKEIGWAEEMNQLAANGGTELSYLRDDLEGEDVTTTVNDDTGTGSVITVMQGEVTERGVLTSTGGSANGSHENDVTLDHQEFNIDSSDEVHWLPKNMQPLPADATEVAKEKLEKAKQDWADECSRKRCGNPDCRAVGHELSDCCVIDDTGRTRGCPVCNGILVPGGHDWWQCPRLEKLTPSLLWHILVGRRDGKPQFRMPFSMWLLDPALWDRKPSRPQTMEYALARKEKIGRDQTARSKARDPTWNLPNPLQRVGNQLVRGEPALDPAAFRNEAPLKKPSLATGTPGDSLSVLSELPAPVDKVLALSETAVVDQSEKATIKKKQKTSSEDSQRQARSTIRKNESALIPTGPKSMRSENTFSRGSTWQSRGRGFGRSFHGNGGYGSGSSFAHGAYGMNHPVPPRPAPGRATEVATTPSIFVDLPAVQAPAPASAILTSLQAMSNANVPLDQQGAILHHLIQLQSMAPGQVGPATGRSDSSRFAQAPPIESPSFVDAMSSGLTTLLELNISPEQQRYIMQDLAENFSRDHVAPQPPVNHSREVRSGPGPSASSVQPTQMTRAQQSNLAQKQENAKQGSMSGRGDHEAKSTPGKMSKNARRRLKERNRLADLERQVRELEAEESPRPASIVLLGPRMDGEQRGNLNSTSRSEAREHENRGAPKGPKMDGLDYEPGS